MTTSTELLHRARAPRRGCRISSSSVTPRAAPRRCTRCSAAIRRSSCPTSRSPLLRTRPERVAGARRMGFRARWRSTCRCSPLPAGSSASARRRRHMARAGPRRHRRAAARCAHHRDPARAGKLPALTAPAAAAGHIETETGSAQGDGARGGRREGRRIPDARVDRGRCCTQSMFNTSSSCADITLYFPGADAGSHLRRFQRGKRGDGANGCCGSWVSTTAAPIEVMEANPTVRMRSQQLDEIVRCASTSGAGLPGARQGGDEGARAAGAAPRALEPLQRRVVSRPSLRDEGLMLELRRRFKPEVVAVSEYLGRDLVSLWGYDEHRLTGSADV